MRPLNPTHGDLEAAMRRLLSDHDLPEPDEIVPHEDGGILCLWHEQKVAVIVDPDEAHPATGRSHSATSRFYSS